MAPMPNPQAEDPNAGSPAPALAPVLGSWVQGPASCTLEGVSYEAVLEVRSDFNGLRCKVLIVSRRCVPSRCP